MSARSATKNPSSCFGKLNSPNSITGMAGSGFEAAGISWGELVFPAVGRLIFAGYPVTSQERECFPLT